VGRFLLRRLFAMVVVLWAVVTCVFLITHVLPADPARAAAGFNAGPAQVEAVRERLGLDRPLAYQYGIYLRNLARFDLGTSVRSQKPVTDDLRSFLPATIELTIVGSVVYIVLSLILGVLAALSRRNRLSTMDGVIRLLSVVGVALPAFWLALLLQLLFFRRLGWLPSGGRLDFTTNPPREITGLYLVDGLLTGNFAVVSDAASHLVLPVVALVLGPLPIGIRIVRNAVLQELGESYVQTARAKGLSDRSIVVRHVLRNALIPATTLFGTQIGYLLGGAFLVESVFLWPGIGRYAVTSLQSLDYNAVIGVSLVLAAFFLIVNMLVDVAYGFLDPRVRQ
jgi:peptide/nickel transport system permease protein